MANDTRRMEAENTTWALVVAELERLSNLGSDSGRWDGVISLHDLLKAHPPDETETTTSLQRELAEAREHAKEVRLALTSIRAAVDADLGLARASNESPVEVNGELYRTKILEAIAALKSRASLTPLTDPSVYGVLCLAKDGDPPKNDIVIAGVHYQLRPASEFGVAARGEPGLKKLPDGAIVFTPRMPGDKDCVMYLGKWFKEHTGSNYAIPDGAERIKELDRLVAHLRETLQVERKYADEKQAERDQLDVMCHEGAARCERLGERIKELEAERQLSPSVEEALSAINRALLFFRQGDQSGCDGMNEREISLASTAGIKLIRNAFGTEQSMHSAWRKRATESESDAERLRKAIEEIRDVIAPHPAALMPRYAVEAYAIAAAALSPSPAAASGEMMPAEPVERWGDIDLANTKMRTTSFEPAADGGLKRTVRSETLTEFAERVVPTSAPAAESDKPYGLVEQMDAGEGTVYGRRVTVKRREEPAAGTQGNAQHHIEGAKIPEGSSGSVAAESEGGDWEEQCNGLVAETEVERLEQCIEVYERSCTQWAEQCNGLIAERDALSARLAACEERCKELEAGIREHQSAYYAAYKSDSIPSRDLELWSLLAPKAGGEDAVV